MDFFVKKKKELFYPSIKAFESLFIILCIELKNFIKTNYNTLTKVIVAHGWWMWTHPFNIHT